MSGRIGEGTARIGVGFQHENGYEAVNFRCEGVSGLLAIGGHFLRFSVHYTAQPWNPDWSERPSIFRGVRAAIEVADNGGRLATVGPERPIVIEHHKYPQSSTSLFELLLTAWQIERLEEIRRGGKLEFLLRFAAERIGQNGRAVVDADIRVPVAESDWLTVLAQMQFGDYLLCEIPIEYGDNETLREAWVALDKARDLLYQGHYKNVVAECRTAIEATIEAFKLQQRLSDAVKEKKNAHRDMLKDGRILNLYDAVRHVCQLAVHIDAANQYVDFSRREAVLIYSATAACTATLSEQRPA